MIEEVDYSMYKIVKIDNDDQSGPAESTTKVVVTVIIRSMAASQGTGQIGWPGQWPLGSGDSPAH